MAQKESVRGRRGPCGRSGGGRCLHRGQAAWAPTRLKLCNPENQTTTKVRVQVCAGREVCEGGRSCGCVWGRGPPREFDTRRLLYPQNFFTVIFLTTTSHLGAWNTNGEGCERRGKHATLRCINFIGSPNSKRAKSNAHNCFVELLPFGEPFRLLTDGSSQ